MTTLPPTTKSRLQKIPRSNVVWEGDRRPLGNMASHLDVMKHADEECIIWIDGSEGTVRAMDVVTKDIGLEGVVRTLLRAIESPHHPSQPHRPQKIIVRDREIQFFLRGVLQELDIAIEYSPELPLIDRLFEGFAFMDEERQSPLPELYESLVENLAEKIWHQAPWELLADSDIIQVELKGCEIEQVYLCVMGMMSAEYGVLIYRSLESLQQFRAAALGEKQSPAELEQAFLAQDCWFLNYETAVEDKLSESGEVQPFFGSLHPFEGMRHSLDETETKIVYATLESLLRFYSRNHEVLAEEPIEALSKSYRITLPSADGERRTISTKVSTLPELTAELLNMGQGDRSGLLEDTVDIPIQEDLIPDGSLISLASIPQELIKQLQHQPRTYCQSSSTSHKASEIPTILIQTTRPKAQDLITRIRNAGGLKAVCFNPGHDPFSGEVYDLGMLQTEDDELFIFAEYSHDVVQQAKALEKWHQRCQKTHGYCSLVVAMGSTGNHRGNPRAKDMLAVFEVKSINGAELGMGVLQLMPSFDF
ncbi:MAG: hypothetical protein AAFQ80_22590 [Cyanobacteria bacterium J06621_8]